MKRIVQIALLIVSIGTFTVLCAQETPPGASDSSLRNDNIRLRSIELERIKREAEKSAMIRRDNGTELNFDVVKADFEGIQNLQSLIVEGYTKGKEIDYKKINKSAGKMTESAIRLKANLFPSTAPGNESDKDPEKAKSDETAGRGVRDLIIDLDNAIGRFVASPMFKDLSIVDLEASKKTSTDLEEIIRLSGALWLESNMLRIK